MCTSLDGKIIGHRWGKLPGYKHESELFETTAASFGIGAWLVGTTTMDEFDGPKIKLPRAKTHIPRRDFIGNKGAKSFGIGGCQRRLAVSEKRGRRRPCRSARDGSGER